MPKYAAKLPRGAIFAGDTMDGFAFTLFDGENTPQIPSKICCQLRGRNGQLLHTFDYVIESSGLCKINGLSKEETAKLPIGVHEFGVQVTLPSGRVRTFIIGTQEIVRGAPRC